jgi:TetR/AcrR family transcriptional regulator, cholesterol catabolism regulator
MAKPPPTTARKPPDRPRRATTAGRAAGGGYAPERTRRALIDNALKLFGTKGYAVTSVQEITEAAKVTKGAFYHHFDSKEELLKVIHDEFLDYQLAVLKEALAEDEHPATRLRELLRTLLASTARYQANVTVFYLERRHLHGDYFKEMRRKRDEFDRLFLEVIERGIAQGSFRSDLDAHVVALGILGMCAWVHQWYRPSGQLSAEQIADTFAELALDGLLAEKPRSRPRTASHTD